MLKFVTCLLVRWWQSYGIEKIDDTFRKLLNDRYGKHFIGNEMVKDIIVQRRFRKLKNYVTVSISTERGNQHQRKWVLDFNPYRVDSADSSPQTDANHVHHCIVPQSDAAGLVSK